MGFDHIVEQGGCPSGALGGVVCGLMDAVNNGVQRDAIALLPYGKPLDVIEIGFGGLGLYRQLCGRRRLNRYVGVDRSETCVMEAGRNAIGSINASFVHADVEAIPLPSGSFDVALAMNTLLWWDVPQAGLMELRRLMVRGGTLVIGMVTRRAAAQGGMLDQPGGPRYHSVATVRHWLAQVGFDPEPPFAFVDRVAMGGAETHREYCLLRATAF